MFIYTYIYTCRTGATCQIIHSKLRYPLSYHSVQIGGMSDDAQTLASFWQPFLSEHSIFSRNVDDYSRTWKNYTVLIMRQGEVFLESINLSVLFNRNTRAQCNDSIVAGFQVQSSE